MRTFRSIFRLPAACPIFSPGHQVARLFRRRYRTVQWNFAARKRTPGSVGTMLVRARGVTVRVMRFVGPFRQSRLGLRAETGADGCGTIFEIPEIPFSQIKPQVIAEYKRLAKEIITERVHYFSELTGWKAESVKIGNAKTRWGSCSGTNSLNFTWKLIFSDLNTIDYVVLHELAHTKEHNHSQRFWNLVAEYMPNYKEIRERLIAVQKKLMQENWD